MKQTLVLHFFISATPTVYPIHASISHSTCLHTFKYSTTVTLSLRYTICFSHQWKTFPSEINLNCHDHVCPTLHMLQLYWLFHRASHTGCAKHNMTILSYSLITLSGSKHGRNIKVLLSICLLQLHAFYLNLKSV